jgi:4-amino-4-deoxy-L-arabinose transferase-like glycosyltransferase
MKKSKDQIYSIYFYAFVATHVFVWTLLPTLLRYDLALDSIEAISWGYEWQLGYIKHPPLSAWLAEGMINIFSHQMWAIYFLAQICVALAFIATWELAKDFLSRQQAFMSILLLECIYYYNFTSTEFNANIALLPFWAWVTLYAWRVSKNPDLLKNWLILAVFSALALFAKYYALMLFAGIFLLFLYDKNLRRSLLSINPYVFAILLIFLISPHIFWLIENNFVTFSYAKSRAASKYHLYNHLLNPFLFFCAQVMSLLLPCLVFFLARRKDFSSTKLDQHKKNFLIFVGLAPLFLTMIPSLFTGSGIKDMWGSVLWSWFGVALFYFFQPKISPDFERRFYRGFAVVFVIALIVFIGSQAGRLHKYGHFDGRLLVQKIHEKHPEPIAVVVGDVWLTGNFNFFDARSGI